MSILHICCNLAGSRVFPQLFEALRAEGHEQIVFVPEKRKADLGKNVPAGVETHSALTVKKSDALFFARKAKRTVPEIEKTVNMGRVTMMHAHTLFTDGSIAYALHVKYNLPYVVTLRYSDIEVIWKYEPHLRPLARRILREAAKVVFLSEASRQKVLGSWLNKQERASIEEKTAIIPNGIAPEWLDGAPREASADPVRVGFAGKLDKRKCPLDAFLAVHRARRQGGSFVFRACGEGPLMDELVSMLHEGDQYVGVARGMEAMKRFYAGCDVLLVPSSAETFGMVYLEAMSQGVPVLYTRGQGFDGQFAEGEVGYSVVNSDVNQQAKMLEEIMKDYAARSARCVEHAKAYAWPLVAAKWTALYQSI